MLNTITSRIQIIPKIFPYVLESYFKKGSEATYDTTVLSRLFMMRLINENKIVYIDGEAFGGISFQELADLEFNDSLLLGVVDQGVVENTAWLIAYLKSIQLNPSIYINSGVLIVKNEPRTRELFEKAIEYVNSGNHQFPDQDALNAVFSNNNTLRTIDKKFNCRTKTDKENCIFHHYRFPTFLVNIIRRLFLIIDSDKHAGECPEWKENIKIEKFSRLSNTN